ncbi:hypothetical protein QBC44DRAFT_391434 [Cladorrhinum sp. PSN332]|nr:hypothetical protein QBC44DRAFT_391434 [Cladorrhinum sp. PSN332]
MQSPEQPEPHTRHYGNVSADNGEHVFSGALSVTLNVNGTPLESANINGLSIGALKTALQLATGASGWFKAAERSQSLTQVLSSAGMQLKSASSFHLRRYQQLREDYDAMQGVVVENGVSTTFPLPKASTGVSDIPGMSCLRAVTVCLACICNEDSAASILKELVPFGLLDHDMKDGELDMEGPLLASLKEWVRSVFLEESSNKFRDHLLKRADEELNMLRPLLRFEEIIPESERHAWLEMDSGDESLVLGVLKWALTPTHERQIGEYMTRSLGAWTAALLMSELGFTIHASTQLMPVGWSRNAMMNDCLDGEQRYDVFLNVAGDGDTDPLAQPTSVPDTHPPPRATLLENVPALMFRHVKYMKPPLDDAYLREAYKYSFTKARGLLSKIDVKDFYIQIHLKDYEPIPCQELLSPFFNILSPHLHRLCVPAFVNFVGPWHNLDLKLWDLSDHEKFFAVRRESGYKSHYTILAIALGAMYGICSHACQDQGEPLWGSSEIAFNADSLYRNGCGRLRKWARMVGLALEGSLQYHQWTELLFEMFVGAGDNKGEEDAAVSSKGDGYVFGIQCNGFTAVSDILVRLKINPQSLSVFHITRGQLLNLPCDERGYVKGSTFLPYSVTINEALSWTYERRLYRTKDSTFDSKSTRLDVEPCWDDDTRTVILSMRQMGKRVASLNLGRVLQRMSRCVVTCSDSCERRSNEAALPSGQGGWWYRLYIASLRPNNLKLKPGQQAKLKRNGRSFLIDASQCQEAFVYVLGIIDTDRIVIAQDCLECAFKTTPPTRTNESTVIVIPPGNSLVKDTREQVEQRIRDVETDPSRDESDIDQLRRILLMELECLP